MTKLLSALFGVVAIALIYIIINYRKIYKMSEGTNKMAEMAKIIRDGATTFMITEYKVIAVVVVIIAVLCTLFIEKTACLTFLIGACMSTAACTIGMKVATYAGVRTANTARKTLSVGKTVKTALAGGSVSGLSVHTFGLLGVIIILIIFGLNPAESGHGLLTSLACTPFLARMTTYSLGCSLVAMFNRVAGGVFTKSADISADEVAKRRHDLPEDDPRCPNVMADFVGDNVNDIAGNCSDLLESFVATITASFAIAVLLYKVNNNLLLFRTLCIYALILAGGGLLSSLVGLCAVSLRKMSDNPSKELNLATYVSAGMIAVISLIASYFVFSDGAVELGFKLGWISPWISAALGIASGVLIGIVTEYYTSADYRPTQNLAKSALQGEAFLVTAGDAIGSRSCLLPMSIISISIIVSGSVCGFYGLAISALGMLSFVGTTVSIDAFGPIADNAGGLAETCGLGEEVRAITDKLDSTGNTTAAIGKGFAIGSAAFATVSLITAYVGNYSDIATEPILNIASYTVIAGAFIGAALIEFFIHLLTTNTGQSAMLMADEGERQLSVPGVIEGTVKPDYSKCIELATKEALGRMLKPSLLALLVPVFGGFLFGVGFVGGILVGATVVAIPRAIFMGNSGGAFDNSKKHIESGAIAGHGKGSAAHKAAVAGDTIGDTRKDVVGVALDIFIKMMSTVANTLAPLFSSFTLF